MEQLIHITATYSNALLVAILPHISNFAKKLDLPISQPITADQVIRFNPNPYKGHLSGSVVLTNRYWFVFDQGGFVQSFRSPDDFFFDNDALGDNLTNFLGHTRMTTNEMVALARETLLKLGYNPEITRADTLPELQLPFDLKQGGQIPYCMVTWCPIKDFSESYSKVHVEINTQNKSIVGLYVLFARTNNYGMPLKIGVEPELESDYRKRTGVKMFLRTNAPPHLPQAKPPGTD
jgi:hypothetical protein